MITLTVGDYQPIVLEYFPPTTDSGWTRQEFGRIVAVDKEKRTVTIEYQIGEQLDTKEQI